MTKKKTATTKGEAKTKVKVSPTVTTATETEAVKNTELVMEAGINIKAEDANAKIEKLPPEMRVKKFAPAQNIQTASSTTMIINTSQNPILLSGDDKEECIYIAPKEIKRVNRNLLKKLLQNKVVRYWFDKGILTGNADANETTANEAEAPEYLSQPVERHDGANISASVTKFEKQGSVTINL